MTEKSFKALVVEETEDKKYKRQILNKTIDDLPPGDVVVEVHYSSLNYKDALSAIGNKGVMAGRGVGCSGRLCCSGPL